MRKRKSLIILGICILVPVFAVIFKKMKTAPPYECADTIGCVTIAPDEPIVIGVIQDLSGSAAAFGLEQLRSIEIALGRRNNRILSHEIILKIEDEGCSPEGGSVAAGKLSCDTRVIAILGTTCSHAAVRASQIMSEAGLVMISGANTAPNLTSVKGKRGSDWYPGYFRTIYNAYETGREVAKFAFRELGVTRGATINDGDAYTRGYAEAFQSMFTELGGQIVQDGVISKGEMNMHPILTAVLNSGAELLFLPLFEQEGLAVVRQVNEVAGLENIILVGGPTILTENFFQSIGVDGIGTYFLNTGPSMKNADVRRLISDFRARYGRRPQTPGFDFAYDAANLLLHALKTAVVVERNGTLHIGRRALRDALYRIKDFPGLRGRLTCDEFGDCGVSIFNIVRLDDPAAGFEALKANIVYSPAK